MKHRLIYALAISSVLLVACNRQRMIYLQDKTEQETPDSVMVFERKPQDYKIKPNDLLRINVSSPDEEIQELFNQRNYRNSTTQSSPNNQSNTNSDINEYFMAYHVLDSGYIRFPVVGKIHVEDLTPYEAQVLVQKKVNEYVDNVIVDLFLVSYKVTFMGEFNTPGIYKFYQHELNIYEAMVQAGGISVYGDRRKVLLIRKYDDRYETYRIDMTDRQLLADERLYVLPNDIIYVEPLPVKTFQIDAQNMFFYLTTLTSLITTMLLIYNTTK